VPDQKATVRVQSGKADGDVALQFKGPAGKVWGRVVFTDASDPSGIG